MDQNQDSFVDKEDLKDTYTSLGGCGQEVEWTSTPMSLLFLCQARALAPKALRSVLPPQGERPAPGSLELVGCPGGQDQRASPSMCAWDRLMKLGEGVGACQSFRAQQSLCPLK